LRIVDEVRQHRAGRPHLRLHQPVLDVEEIVGLAVAGEVAVGIVGEARRYVRAERRLRILVEPVRRVVAVDVVAVLPRIGIGGVGPRLGDDLAGRAVGEGDGEVVGGPRRVVGQLAQQPGAVVGEGRGEAGAVYPALCVQAAPRSCPSILFRKCRDKAGLFKFIPHAGLARARSGFGPLAQDTEHDHFDARG
jgi:hypothetical protein